MKFKLSLYSALVPALTLFSLAANAAKLDVKSTVKSITVHDSVTFPSTASSYFRLDGVSALGNCDTVSGYVVFRIRDDSRGDAMKSLLTAALLSGKEVEVKVDDVNLVDIDGYCIAYNVTLET